MRAGTPWIAVSIACAALVGCGRIAFDARTDAGSGVDHDSGDDAADLCAGFALCETFEAATLDPARWTSSASVTLDTTVQHRGNASVKFETPALAIGAFGYSVIRNNTALAAVASTFSVRLWVRLAALPAGSNGMELAATVSAGPQQGNYIELEAPSLRLYAQFSVMPSRGVSAAPTGSWFCLVWKIVRAPTTAGSLTLTGDVTATTLSGVPTDDATPIDQLQLGIGWAGNVNVMQPAFTMWIDDVIVDSSDLTCAD